MLEYSKPESEGRAADGASTAAEGVLPDDYSEWDDYVPDGIHISEAERQRLHREHEKYLAELIEEFGEPTPEERARRCLLATHKGAASPDFGGRR